MLILVPALIITPGLVKIQQCVGATCDGGDDRMKEWTVCVRLEKSNN